MNCHSSGILGVRGSVVCVVEKQDVGIRFGIVEYDVMKRG
jgi:hypothetical protein